MLGARTEEAADGAEAVSAIETGHDRFALVIMDCEMPVCDGFDATRQIRQWEALNGKKRLKIVALTGNAMQADKDKCLAAGMDGHMSKPINKAAVETVLASVRD